MSIYVISDTHFNHKNVIEYCHRPFYNVKHMNNTIIKNWNSVIQRNDIVYHLGDFSFGTKEMITDLVSKLNGNIYLVLGNHDGTSVKKYYDAGFKRVYDTPIFLKDYNIVLSHKPLDIPNNNFMLNICGHIHNNEEIDPTTAAICACVELIDYIPKPIEYFINEYRKKKSKIAF